MVDRSSVRVIVTLPAGIYALLEASANAEDRAAGNLAGFILETWLREHAHTAPLVELLPPSDYVRSSPTSP